MNRVRKFYDEYKPYVFSDGWYYVFIVVFILILFIFFSFIEKRGNTSPGVGRVAHRCSAKTGQMEECCMRIKPRSQSAFGTCRGATAPAAAR